MSIDYSQPHLATYQSHWETQGYNLDLPDWVRLYSFTVARAAPNLHAEFASNQLAQMMGKPVNGQFEPMAGPRLSNVINQAIERKFIDESSIARCLVLPAHAWGCGLSGADATCATHIGKPSKPRRFYAPKKRHEENLEKRMDVSTGHSVLASL